MTELRPLLEDGAMPLEVALLREARAVTLSDAAAQRAMAALGVSGAATTVGLSAAAGTAAKSGPALALLVAKWMVVGLAGGLVTLGAADQVGLLGSRSHGSPPVATPPKLQQPPPPPVVRTVPIEQPVPTAAPSAQASVSPPRAASAHVATAHDLAELLPSHEVAPGSTLAREVALIDRARAALDAGNADKALRALDEYQRAVQAGRLGPEAAYLRVAALLARGDRSAAEAAARQLLQSDPTSPHAKRVRALLDRARAGLP